MAATAGLGAAMASATHASPTTTGVAVSGATTSRSAASSSTAGGAPTTASSNGSASATTTATPASYEDGTYTGTAVDNTFGNVQVKATITNHKLVSVEVVEAPSDHKSQRINSEAAPTLEQEAVAAQSSTLDVVSGATYTSQAYATSLQAALDQAKPATTSTSP